MNKMNGDGAYMWASWIFVGGMRRDVRPPDGGCRGVCRESSRLFVWTGTEWDLASILFRV
jgi:hypothetical protein